MKRLKQAVTSKDTIIQDLKEKLEIKKSLEEIEKNITSEENNSKVINSSTVPSADVTGPILSDLKYRLKQSELEKNRIKKSLTNMTEKNETVQKQLEIVKADLEKAKKNSEKVESLRSQLIKKDTNYKLLQNELENEKKVSIESENNFKKAKKELEKDIRQLQRTVQILEQQKDLLEKELEVIRINRISATETKYFQSQSRIIESKSQVPQNIKNSNNLDSEKSNINTFNPDPNNEILIKNQPAQQQQQNKNINPIVLPASLDDSVQDLNDILSGNFRI